jgi:hypothetical protein
MEDIDMTTHHFDDRIQLTCGATIADVYARFVDGLSTERRSRAELQAVIHGAGLRYEECARLSVSARWAERVSNDPQVAVNEDDLPLVERCHGEWTVADPNGGRWWSSAEARAEIEASADPQATALRICNKTPTRGKWVD